MIDWLSIRVPIMHEPIQAGRVMKITPHGEIDWESECWFDAAGSHDHNIRMRSHGPANLDISGNFLKWLQGHNLFGTNDVQGLVHETLASLSERGFIAIAADARHLVNASRAATVSRIDLTEMFELPSRAACRAWIKAAESTAHMAHRGRGTLTREGTLYFGKASRRSMLKIYVKGDEIEAQGKGHKLPADLPFRDALCTWADNKLRVELQLRTLTLVDLELQMVGSWGDNEPLTVFSKYLSTLNLNSQMPILGPDLDKLPAHLRSTYQHWWTGFDVRSVVSKATFYRHRRELLSFGIDIAMRRPAQPLPAVAQLRQVLEAKPAGVPTWATGTTAFFEPRALAA